MDVENLINICIGFDAAILGIAYPIIINESSKIGEKFSSKYLKELYDSSLLQRKVIKRINFSLFETILLLAVISFFFILLGQPPLFGWDNRIINNSAHLLTICLTIILIFSFFWWVIQFRIFNGNAISILDELIKGYNKEAKEEKRKLFLKAINEIAIYAVKQQDRHLEQTLITFYHQVFADERKKHNANTPFEYSADLYDIMFKLNRLFVQYE